MIEKIRTIRGQHPIKYYPFIRDSVAFRCTVCGGIWLEESEAQEHTCKSKREK
jgi:hypothetical protein